VIATARGDERAWMERFGASETIDYAQRPVGRRIARHRHGGARGKTLIRI
jgi:hypothetical protein